VGCAIAGGYDLEASESETVTYPANIVAGDVLVLYVTTYRLFAGSMNIFLPDGFVELDRSNDGRAQLLCYRIADGTESGTFPLVIASDPDWTYYTLVRITPLLPGPPLDGAIGDGWTIPGVSIPLETRASVLLAFIGGAVSSGSGIATSSEGLCRVRHLGGSFYAPGITTFLDCRPPGPTGDLNFSADNSSGPKWGRCVIPSRAACGSSGWTIGSVPFV
jgi:hypothetical protein